MKTNIIFNQYEIDLILEKELNKIINEQRRGGGGGGIGPTPTADLLRASDDDNIQVADPFVSLFRGMYNIPGTRDSLDAIPQENLSLFDAVLQTSAFAVRASLLAASPPALLFTLMRTGWETEPPKSFTGLLARIGNAWASAGKEIARDVLIRTIRGIEELKDEVVEPIGKFVLSAAVVSAGANAIFGGAGGGGKKPNSFKSNPSRFLKILNIFEDIKLELAYKEIEKNYKDKDFAFIMRNISEKVFENFQKLRKSFENNESHYSGKLDAMNIAKITPEIKKDFYDVLDRLEIILKENPDSFNDLTVREEVKDIFLEKLKISESMAIVAGLLPENGMPFFWVRGSWAYYESKESPGNFILYNPPSYIVPQTWASLIWENADDIFNANLQFIEGSKDTLLNNNNFKDFFKTMVKKDGFLFKPASPGSEQIKSIIRNYYNSDTKLSQQQKNEKILEWFDILDGKKARDRDGGNRDRKRKEDDDKVKIIPMYKDWQDLFENGQFKGQNLKEYPSSFSLFRVEKKSQLITPYIKEKLETEISLISTNRKSDIYKNFLKFLKGVDLILEKYGENKENIEVSYKKLVELFQEETMEDIKMSVLEVFTQIYADIGTFCMPGNKNYTKYTTIEDVNERKKFLYKAFLSYDENDKKEFEKIFEAATMSIFYEIFEIFHGDSQIKSAFDKSTKDIREKIARQSPPSPEREPEQSSGEQKKQPTPPSPKETDDAAKSIFGNIPLKPKDNTDTQPETTPPKSKGRSGF